MYQNFRFDKNTLQIKDRWCIMGMCEADQTQTVIARGFQINQNQVSWLIAKYPQTSDVTDSHGLGDIDCLLQQTIECLCDWLFVILWLLVLNFVSLAKS